MAKERGPLTNNEDEFEDNVGLPEENLSDNEIMEVDFEDDEEGGEIAEGATRGGVEVEHSIKTAKFTPTVEKPFSHVVLTEVRYAPSKNEDTGVIRPRLLFTFRGAQFIHGDSPRVPMFIHPEWIISLGDIADDDEKKVKERMRRQDENLAHIYDVLMGDGAHKTAGPGGSPIGTYKGNGNQWEGFFKSVETSFNTGRKGKPVFKTVDEKYIQLWLKLVYYGTRLQVALGNFLDKATAKTEPNLTVPTAEQLTPKSRKSKRDRNAGGGGAAAAANDKDDILPPGFD